MNSLKPVERHEVPPFQRWKLSAVYEIEHARIATFIHDQVRQMVAQGFNRETAEPQLSAMLAEIRRIFGMQSTFDLELLEAASLGQLVPPRAMPLVAKFASLPFWAVFLVTLLPSIVAPKPGQSHHFFLYAMLGAVAGWLLGHLTGKMLGLRRLVGSIPLGLALAVALSSSIVIAINQTSASWAFPILLLCLATAEAIRTSAEAALTVSVERMFQAQRAFARFSYTSKREEDFWRSFAEAEFRVLGSSADSAFEAKVTKGRPKGSNDPGPGREDK